MKIEQPKNVQLIKGEAASFAGLGENRMRRPAGRSLKDQSTPSVWARLFGGLVGVVMFCALVVGLFHAAVWIYEQIPASEYKKATDVANSLQCSLSPEVAEREESRVQKNFMDQNVAKIKAYAEQHHKGVWQFRSSLQEEVAVQAKEFNDACAEYRRINQRLAVSKPKN